MCTAVDVKKEKKVRVRHRTLVYCQTVCHSIFGKNGCVRGTTLHDQISAEFKLQGSALQTVVTATKINTIATVIEEDQASHSWYFEKEWVTKEDTEREDNESVMDDE